MVNRRVLTGLVLVTLAISMVAVPALAGPPPPPRGGGGGGSSSSRPAPPSGSSGTSSSSSSGPARPTDAQIAAVKTACATAVPTCASKSGKEYMDCMRDKQTAIDADATCKAAVQANFPPPPPASSSSSSSSGPARPTDAQIAAVKTACATAVPTCASKSGKEYMDCMRDKQTAIDADASCKAAVQANFPPPPRRQLAEDAAPSEVDSVKTVCGPEVNEKCGDSTDFAFVSCLLSHMEDWSEECKGALRPMFQPLMDHRPEDRPERPHRPARPEGPAGGDSDSAAFGPRGNGRPRGGDRQHRGQPPMPRAEGDMQGMEDQPEEDFPEDVDLEDSQNGPAPRGGRNGRHHRGFPIMPVAVAAGVIALVIVAVVVYRRRAAAAPRRAVVVQGVLSSHDPESVPLATTVQCV